ncbi:MAG TPA: MBL fold metallo-hydrolase [Candidatus Pacearchaeota archaeon]|jgi:L-ascorbate metabolism protein UlaG (beta-lactamase superfamily)|nr:MBL fold metallo-hydrolase [Candidatus Pacearchaeota archaeon]HRR94771.1 MBL fold metallo-hydrolase [Candidatus Paceibacterota bacterium]HPC30594.1 MBL fold metallo-hydrolase [Candidatus Pacearchaeota archaeon]HQG09158.1 MBL fold metallo-hydrolase [Candidatus Pacearchaeota archaeon]HQH20333.1 MBL fold metallo-hydrolase [Candidatus Pacearchaeota archaeon]
MKIIWHGGDCFEIMSVSPDKDNLSIQIGLKESEKKNGKFGADILLKNNNLIEVKPKTDGQFVVGACGEYEIKGIFIQGIPSFKIDKKTSNIIYLIEAEGIRICHLGVFGQDDLNDEQLEAMGNVDILIVPINGDETIGPKEAEKIITRLEPKIVIPAMYKSSDILANFLKIMGQKDVVAQEKLSLQKKNLGSSDSEEKTEVVVLEPK